MSRLSLFLSSSGLVGLLLCSLFTCALVFRLASRISQLSVSPTLDRLWHLALLDLGESSRSVNDRKTVLDPGDGILDSLNLLLGSVVLLVLTDLAGEKNQTGTVFL